ncbi:MAG: hypothetical protein P1V97_12790, partial [Planctomycetota bacterium]|nr:hypothetical protein [Planctomycetota bacterium]
MTLRTLLQGSLLTCAMAAGLSISPLFVEAGDPDKKTKEKSQQKKADGKDSVKKAFKGEIHKDGEKQVFTDPEEFKKHLKALEKDIDALRGDLKETRLKILKKMTETRKKFGENMPLKPG